MSVSDGAAFGIGLQLFQLDDRLLEDVAERVEADAVLRVAFAREIVVGGQEEATSACARRALASLLALAEAARTCGWAAAARRSPDRREQAAVETMDRRAAPRSPPVFMRCEDAFQPAPDLVAVGLRNWSRLCRFNSS